MPQATLTVNGKRHTVVRSKAAIRCWWELLREKLGLTGTHVGWCRTRASAAPASCHVDGVSAKSCTMLALQADGTSVLTIEGLAAADGTLHPMQEEMFREHHALQCGFCTTPGMVMSAIDLVNSHPGGGLTEKQIREGLEGNLCRCTRVPIISSRLSQLPGH